MIFPLSSNNGSSPNVDNPLALIMYARGTMHPKHLQDQI